MPADSKKVIETALLLRAAVPQQWQEFVMAMREYAAQQANEMITCPPELLAKAQGMAVMAVEISGLLVNAQKIAEKAQQFRKDQVHGSRPSVFGG